MPGFSKIEQQVGVENLSVLQVSVGIFLTPEGTFMHIHEDFKGPDSLHVLPGT